MTWRAASALAPGAHLEAEVGVVGAGPAGLAVALALAEAGTSVALLEAGERDDGALERGDDGLELGAGSGEFRRHRRFGGTLWYGRCVPLDAIDFEARAWVPGSGWPLPRAEVEAWVPAAARWLGISRPELLSVEAWRGDPAVELLGGGGLAPKPHLVSPAKDLGRRFRGRVAASPRLEAVLGATLVGIDLAAAGGRVERLRFAGADRAERALRAGRWVLACGGFENARQLLLLEAERPGALGVSVAAMGGFVDHPRCDGAARWRLDPAHPASAALYRSLVEHPERRARCRMQVAFGLDPGLQRAEELLNPCGFFYPVSAPPLRALGEEAAGLRADLARGRWSAAAARRLFRLALGGPRALPALVARARRRPYALDHLALVEQLEQPPDAAGRLSLAASRDGFGRPRLRVEWNAGEASRHTQRRLHELLARRIAGAGAGRLESRLLAEPGWRPAPSDAGHPMRSTPMADDPARGVVDRDARVHGLANLWIAGSSVFPGCGHANPTLTLVALALRLADHLGARERARASA